jgi:nucleoside-diphosphate-sugar epimerase
MRIFVTGASGWIGSAVVPELLDAGHHVVGLARSDASAKLIASAGAEVCRGDLDDLELLASAADAADAVAHLAFKHDLAFSGGFEAAAIADRRAIDVIGDTLAGSDRAFVIASGTLGLAQGRIADERDGLDDDEASISIYGAGPSLRRANANATLALAARGVRSSVVRLPPTVHGDGDTGFMATLVAIARVTGVAGYLGDGSNRWPAVHRLDAAHLLRLALEKAPAGSALHAVGDEGVPIRDVAEVMGRHLDVPVAAIADADAPTHFTWLANFIGLDSPASSEATRRLMDWTPTNVGLIEDLEQGHYFRNGSAH